MIKLKDYVSEFTSHSCLKVLLLAFTPYKEFVSESTFNKFKSTVKPVLANTSIMQTPALSSHAKYTAYLKNILISVYVHSLACCLAQV